MTKYVLGKRAARQLSSVIRRERGRPANLRTGQPRRLPGFAYKYHRLFELVETLTEGQDQTAKAKLVRWDDSGSEWVASDDEEDEFTVQSYIPMRETEAGARGIAANLFGQWVIVQLACPDDNGE